MKINDDIDIVDFSKIKWIRWRMEKPTTTAEENDNNPNNRENRQTKLTPGHKSPQPSQQMQQMQQMQSIQTTTAVDSFVHTIALALDDPDDNGNRPRDMHPHIGMNPFLNGSTYLNDIMVQNSMLRGESVRDGGSSLNALK